MDKDILLKESIIQWKNNNRSKLPLNVDSWKIEVFKEGIKELRIPVLLGKYNALLSISDPFYKPYSKMEIV